jgi:hypothetical protein
VVIASLAVNVLWFLPMALLAQAYQVQSGWIAIIAYIPRIWLANRAGVGRKVENLSK